MSSLAAAEDFTEQKPAKVIQPAWVRAMHWTNAFAMVLMIMSGWQIYNASPLFGFTFSPSITLGGWLRGAPLWGLSADVDFDGKRAYLSRLWLRHRPLPQEAAADHAGGRDFRHQGGADRKTFAR